MSRGQEPRQSAHTAHTKDPPEKQQSKANMSDDEEDDYEYEYDDDMEEENLQYTDDEEEQDDTAVALENAYYNAKGNRTVEAFQQVISMEKDKPSLWTFKAMKQIVKLHLRQSDGNAVVDAYKRLLTIVPSISQNAVEKGIGSMLDRVGNDTNVARSVYDSTIAVFHPNTGTCRNERLWFKTNLKYGQLLVQTGELQLLNQVLKELSSHETTSTNAMEIFALQMQLYELTDTKKLRDTFQKAMAVRGGIPHPRTIAMIQGMYECLRNHSFTFDSYRTRWQDAHASPRVCRCRKDILSSLQVLR